MDERNIVGFLSDARAFGGMAMGPRRVPVVVGWLECRLLEPLHGAPVPWARQLLQPLFAPAQLRRALGLTWSQRVRKRGGEGALQS